MAHISQFKSKMTLKVKVDHFHFQYQTEGSLDTPFVQIWCKNDKSTESYCPDKHILARISQFKSKITLKVKVDHTNFQYQAEGSLDTPFVQIWCKNDKSTESYCPDKLILACISQLKSKMTLKVKVDYTHFPYQTERSLDNLLCTFGACRAYLRKVIVRTNSFWYTFHSLSPK